MLLFSICKHFRDASHLRSSSKSLAVNWCRQGCGNACPIYCIFTITYSGKVLEKLLVKVPKCSVNPAAVAPAEFVNPAAVTPAELKKSHAYACDDAASPRTEALAEYQC